MTLRGRLMIEMAYDDYGQDDQTTPSRLEIFECDLRKADNLLPQLRKFAKTLPGGKHFKIWLAVPAAPACPELPALKELLTKMAEHYIDR